MVAALVKAVAVQVTSRDLDASNSYSPGNLLETSGIPVCIEYCSVQWVEEL